MHRIEGTHFAFWQCCFLFIRSTAIELKTTLYMIFVLRSNHHLVNCIWSQAEYNIQNYLTTFVNFERMSAVLFISSNSPKQAWLSLAMIISKFFTTLKGTQSNIFHVHLKAGNNLNMHNSLYKFYGWYELDKL